MDLQSALGWYDEDYLYFSSEITNAERTANELEFIWQILHLRRGETVLDLGCGSGRIANGLAERGAVVTGIDAVPLFLDAHVGMRQRPACRSTIVKATCANSLASGHTMQ